MNQDGLGWKGPQSSNPHAEENKLKFRLGSDLQNSVGRSTAPKEI